MNTLPLRVVIEGVNYAGKDTIVAVLEKIAQGRNAVVIIIRGYWRPDLGAQLRREELLKYFRRRSESFIVMLEAVTHEPVIFMRLHLTDVVYSELYLQAVQDYARLEGSLNQLGVGLVLLDVDDETLAARRETDPRGTSGNADRSLEGLVRKRDLYRRAFERSQMRYKLFLNNSNGGPRELEQVKKILSWREGLT